MQMRGYFKSLSPIKRAAVTGVLAVAAVSVVVVALMLSGSDYVPLLTNVPSDTMGTVVSTLEEKNVKYQIGPDGTSILVPKDLLHSSQLAIMSELGSGRIGQVGFEIFEKQNLGTTSYAQRVNYQRALQGELMRAINSLEAVNKSKVILALPPRKTFMEESAPPKASVVVDLHPGKSLNDEQVQSIVYLVTNAVESMEPENVSVVDSKGRVLSKRRDGMSAGSGELLEIKRKVEGELESRLESILSRVVGEGNVMVRVDASLNSKMVSMVQETVDADNTAIRSVQSEEETLQGNRTNPLGVPGARANLPGAPEAGQVAFNQDVKKELKTTNFEVPKTIKNIKEAAGGVERISVAVIVDGIMETVTNENGETQTVWRPRSADELAKYTNIVKSAVGFNEQRGDTIHIESLQFTAEDFEEAERLLTTLHRERLLRFIATWGLAIFGLGLMFFTVVRPFMRWVTDSFHDSVEDLLPRTIEELEELQSVDQSLPGMSGALPVLEESLDPDKAESELLKDRIMRIMEQDEEKAAGAFSLWLVRRDY
jgi:flagellar M-ring protein FliF